MNVASSCLSALIVLLVAGAFPAAARAQLTGTINAKAPRLSTRIDFAKDSMLELRYTAIAYGKGYWRLLPGRKGEHAAFNRLAAQKPIGTVATTNHVVACGNLIPPGSYDLYFTINRDQCWELNLRKQGGEGPVPINWHMHTQPTPKLQKRLLLGIEPTGQPNAALFRFAFGTQVLTIPLELRDGENPYRRPANPKKKASGSRSEPQGAKKPPEATERSGGKSRSGLPRAIALEPGATAGGFYLRPCPAGAVSSRLSLVTSPQSIETSIDRGTISSPTNFTR